jgi:hypothetical protein
VTAARPVTVCARQQAAQEIGSAAQQAEALTSAAGKVVRDVTRRTKVEPPQPHPPMAATALRPAAAEARP